VSHRFPAVLRMLVLVPATIALSITMALSAAPAAMAAPVPNRTAPTAMAAALRIGQVRGLRIVRLAGAQRGKPYRYGSRGPHSFDCSGYTGYIYREVHLALARTADAQYHQARHIARTRARPGDLVFWLSGRHAYHVAIYAGRGRVWHAPRTGERVKLVRIFDARHVRFGRIGL